MLLEGLCVNRRPAKGAATVGVGDARPRHRSARRLPAGSTRPSAHGPPLDPAAPQVHAPGLAVAQYVAGHYEEAVATLRRAPLEGGEMLMYWAMAQAQLGHAEVARKAAERIRTEFPSFTVEGYIRDAPVVAPGALAAIRDGATKAGLLQAPTRSPSPRPFHSRRLPTFMSMDLGRRERHSVIGNGSTEPSLMGRTRLLSRPLPPLDEYFRPWTAVCLLSGSPGFGSPMTGGLDDTGTLSHAVAATHARRHEAAQHGRQHAQDLRVLGRRLQRLPRPLTGPADARGRAGLPAAKFE